MSHGTSTTGPCEPCHTHDSAIPIPHCVAQARGAQTRAHSTREHEAAAPPDAQRDAGWDVVAEGHCAVLLVDGVERGRYEGFMSHT